MTYYHHQRREFHESRGCWNLGRESCKVGLVLNRDGSFGCSLLWIIIIIREEEEGHIGGKGHSFWGDVERLILK